MVRIRSDPDLIGRIQIIPNMRIRIRLKGNILLQDIFDETSYERTKKEKYLWNSTTFRTLKGSENLISED
jgi:hypothetical protein